MKRIRNVSARKVCRIADIEKDTALTVNQLHRFTDGQGRSGFARFMEHQQGQYHHQADDEHPLLT